MILCLSYPVDGISYLYYSQFAIHTLYISDIYVHIKAGGKSHWTTSMESAPHALPLEEGCEITGPSLPTPCVFHGG